MARGKRHVEASGDVVLDALAELELVLGDLAGQRDYVRRRAELIRRRLGAGQPLSEIVRAEEQPLIVQVLRTSSQQLVEAFSRFQRAEAIALYRDGMTMDAIAQLFGVSRQRIASFLRPS